MADLRKIGVRLTVEGVSEYRSQLAEARRAVKEMSMETKTALANLGTGADRTEVFNTKMQGLTKTYGMQSERLGLLKKHHKDYQTDTKNIGKAMEDTASKIKTANERLERLGKIRQSMYEKHRGNSEQYKRANALYQKQAKHVAELEKEYGQLEKAQKRYTKEQQRVGTEMKKTEMYMALSRQEARQLAEEYRNAGGALAPVADKMQAFGDKAVSTGRKMSEVGQSLTHKVTAPLMAVGTMAAKVAIEYEHQMNRVRVISGATAGEFDKMDAAAREMGQNTIFTAREAAQGMEILAMAGFSATETVDAMAGSLDLAAIAGGNVTLATDAIATSVRAFNLEASDASRVADVFAAATTNSNIRVETLADSMKYAAPMANSLGMSIEDTATAIALMGDAGIKGSMAGTTLRSALSRMARPTGQAATLMNELGIEIFNAEGEMKPLSEVVRELQGGMSGLSKEQQSAAMSTLFGQRAMSGMMVLLEAGPDKVDSFSDSLSNAGGKASEMADEMMESTHGKIKKALSALESAAIELGAAMSPAIIDMAETVRELAVAFTELDSETQANILKWAALAAAMGPVLSIAGSLTTTVGGLAKAGSTTVRTIGKLTTNVDTLLAGFNGTAAAAGGATTSLAEVGSAAGTAAGAKGVGGLVLSLGNALPLIGAVALAVGGGYGVWKLWGEEAYEAGQRTKRWGTDVGEAADQALQNMQNSTSTIGREFNAMSLGVQGDTESMAASFEALGGTVEAELTGRIEQFGSVLEEYSDILSDTTKEMIEKEKSSLEQSLEVVQNYAERANEIRQREANSAVDISAETGKMLSDLSRATAEEYIKTLNLTESEQNNILSALTGNIDTASKEQATAWAQSLGEQRAELDTHSRELDRIADEIIEEMGWSGELAEQFRKDFKEVNEATIQGLDAQLAAIVEKYPEIANEINLSNGEVVSGTEEMQQHIKAANDRIIEDGRRRVDAMGSQADEIAERISWMADEATQGADVWNDLVLEAHEGEFETELPILVAEAAQDAQKWNSMRFQLHDADLNSNAKSVIGEAAIMAGRWDGMSLEEKHIILEDEFSQEMYDAIWRSGEWNEMTLEEKAAIVTSNTAEKMTETLAHLGLWDEYEVEIKEFGADNVGFIESIRESEAKLAYWDSVDPEVKELMGDNYDLLTAIFESEEKLHAFKAIPDEAKAILAENSDFMAKVFSSEEAYTRFMGLSDVEKQMLANDTDLMEKVLGSEEAYNRFKQSGDIQKYIGVDSNADTRIEEIDQLMYGFPLAQYYNVQTDTNASETKSELDGASKSADTMGSKSPHVPTSTDATSTKGELDGASGSADTLNSKSPNVTTSTNASSTKREVDSTTGAAQRMGRQKPRITGSTNAGTVKQSVDSARRAARNKSFTIKGFVSWASNIAGGVAKFFSRNATGNLSYEGGLTYLGDGGRREPYLTPSGVFGVSGTKDELNYLPKGTRIWPSTQAFRASAGVHSKYRDYLKQIPKFAQGGNLESVYDGYTGIVGEAGPEIFQVAQGKVSITPISNAQRSQVLEAQAGTDMTQTNQLLEQVIQLLAQGHVIEMDKREVARTVQPEINSLLTRGFERNNTMKI